MLTRAPAEPDVRRFEAEVASVDGRTVTLSETYFYAESGGQPADRGTLGGVPVTDVQKDVAEEAVVHTLAEEPEFGVGDEVAGVVDDDFRTYCMRAHTASHVLYGAGRRVLDDLGYGGFDIGDEKVRVDFTTTTDIDDEVLVELERLTNRAVWDSRGVTWEEVPAEEAAARDDVAFNTKTEEGVMADADVVRLVDIGEPRSPGSQTSSDDIDGWDVAACGGTHVSNTREIGPVTVIGRSNPGEGLTRVEFAVGPSGIERRATVHRAALDASRELGAAVEDVDEAAASLRAEKESLESDLRELESDLLAGELAEFDAVERDGATWRVGTVGGFGPNDVGEAAKDAVANGEDVVVAVGDGDSPFVVVAAADDEVNAGSVVSDVTDEFGGGGGGGPTFAQGGGLDAAPEDVVTRVRDDA